MTTGYARKRPARASSLLAVAVAAAVILVLSGPQLATAQWLGAELAGLAVVALGAVAARNGNRTVGITVGLVGAVVCVGAIGAFVAGTDALSDALELLPAFLGLAVLTAALVPVRGDGSRLLVKAGAAGLFAAVVLAGLFQSSELTLLLAAAVGSVVAWDAGEHAIGVGEQLGTRASTWRCELPHLAATALVGVLGALAVFAVRGVANDTLSLPAFAMVFVAMVLLTVALRW